jgi:nicotinamidase-related amidase
MSERNADHSARAQAASTAIRDVLLVVDVIDDFRHSDGEALLASFRSAFDLTPLPLLLRELGAQRLILVGATTEMCVAQTAIDARERGYKVTVLADACACVDPTAEQTALSNLRSVTGTFVRCASEWSPGSMLEDRNAAEART